MTLRNLMRSESPTAALSALADDSIAPERRSRVKRRVDESDELRIAFEEERAAVRILRQLRETDRAPEPLRRRIARQLATGRRFGPVHPAALAGALGTAAVASAATVLALAGGTVEPSVAQAATLAMRGGAAPAPRISPQNPNALMRGVGELYFPNWSRTLGWTAVAQRTDRLDRHQAITVYYRRHTERVAYTIVSMPALAQPPGSEVVVADLHLRLLTVAGRHVATWRQDGRTCVLSSRDTPTRQLEQLAAWQWESQGA